MRRKVQFRNYQFYHIFNRGVDKREIFVERQDYYRFIHDLFEFNHQDAIVNLSKRFNIQNYRSPASVNIEKNRRPLVNIVCFCLLPNHFHLALQQLKNEGIVKFMQKLGTGFAKYFNQKFQRTGTLFEGRFKAIHIETDEYLMHLSRYIHLNPVELKVPNWKDKGIKNWEPVKKFLRKYKWSSHLDYLGIRNFPSIVNKNPILSYFKDSASYEKFVTSWLLKDKGKIERLILE